MTGKTGTGPGRAGRAWAFLALAAVGGCVTTSELLNDPLATLGSLMAPATATAATSATEDPAPAAAEAAPPQAPATPAPAPQLTPEGLVGLEQAPLRDLFGQPEWTRNEGPAAIWQYRSSDCVLDLYFFGQAPRAPSLVHMEARPRTGLAESPDQPPAAADPALLTPCAVTIRSARAG